MSTDRLYTRRGVPFELVEIALEDASDSDLMELSRESGTALSLEEIKRIRDFFKQKGRRRTDVEFQSLGQAWSDHCCYKSSKIYLKQYVFGINTRQVIDRGDAGVMEFDKDHAYALRIESHNHPSAVEPYGGATTGIGGVLRGVLAVGAQPGAPPDPLPFARLRCRFRRRGGATGRDGRHGVTYASVDLTEAAVEVWQGGAVQLGDPILKEPLIHACVEAAQAGALDGLKA